MFRRVAAESTPPPRPPRGARRPRGERPARGPYVAMFATALVLRVAYAWIAAGPGAAPFSDAVSYDAVAWNLHRGAGFSLAADGAPAPPTAFVPPVVPWLVSLVYGAFGHDYFAALLLQCLIGATVPLLLAALGGSLLGPSVGRVAGWLAAFHPLLVFFSAYLLTETTFAAALLLALLLSVEWVKTPRPGRALGAGLVWGVATLVRPTALPLPLLIAAWAWVPLGLTVLPRDRVRQVALLLLGAALAVAPWTARNAVAFGAFVPVTTGGGRALLDSHNPEAWGPGPGRGGASSLEYERRRDALRGLPEPEADRAMRTWALDYVRAHATEFPAVAAAKIGRLWRLGAEGGGTGRWQAPGSPLGFLPGWIDPLFAWSLLLFPLAAWGAWRTLSGTRRAFLAIVPLLLVYVTVLAVAFWGALRMRVPFEPLIALLAAAGLEDVRRRVRMRRRGFAVLEGRTG